MREIKFRVWDKAEDYWLHHYLVSRPEGEHGFVLEVDHPGAELGRYVIMQYTGLKDANGTEIYEGDIIKINRGGACGIVEWGTDEWGAPGFRFRGPTVFSQEEWGNMNSLEVIGNLYENPELVDAQPAECL